MPFKRSTIIVLIIAVVCVTAALYIWGNDGLQIAEEQGTQLLFSTNEINVDEVDRIVLSRHGEERMVFARKGAKWRQVEPFDYPMDPYSIRQFAIIASQLEVTSTIDVKETGTNKSTLSLDPPLASLTFHTGDKEQTLLLGEKSVGGRAYLQRDADGPVYVVNQALHLRAVDQHPTQWRDKTLFEHGGIDSNSIIVFRAGDEVNERFELKKEKRKWKMTDPLTTRLDPQTMQEFLGRLSSLQIESFILDQPENISQFGLDKPGASFNITTEVKRSDGSSMLVNEKLLISAQSAQASSYFAKIDSRPVIFTLSVEMLQHLLFPERLIDLTASGTEPVDVMAIRISGDVEFNLQRDDKDLRRWLVVDYNNVEVPASTVNRLLEQLTQVRASDMRQQEFPYDWQVAYVMMTGFDGAPLDTVRVAHEKEGTPWLLENGDGLLRIFPASIQLPITPKDFGIND